jgi:hypothetical protein
MLFTIGAFAALSLIMSTWSFAEQTTNHPVTLLGTASTAGAADFLLVAPPHGGGGSYGKIYKGGGKHFRHGPGYYGWYWPYYGGDFYYYQNPVCWWNGYKFVCSDSSSDYYDVY